MLRLQGEAFVHRDLVVAAYINRHSQFPEVLVEVVGEAVVVVDEQDGHAVVSRGSVPMIAAMSNGEVAT